MSASGARTRHVPYWVAELATTPRSSLATHRTPITEHLAKVLLEACSARRLPVGATGASQRHSRVPLAHVCAGGYNINELFQCQFIFYFHFLKLLASPGLCAHFRALLHRCCWKCTGCQSPASRLFISFSKLIHKYFHVPTYQCLPSSSSKAELDEKGRTDGRFSAGLGRTFSVGKLGWGCTIYR